jgi:hypothetical protein
MSPKFQKPRLPALERPLIESGGPAREARSVQALIEKYEKKAQRVSSLLGLSDATGSMDPVWKATRSHIQEMIRRISELGRFEMRWAAFRDYSEGAQILESSAWHDEPGPLLDFLGAVRCYGGDDREEAVERALELAAADAKATRVVLVGDAPPHANGDWRTQAARLGELGRPVFAFLVGRDREAAAAFREIAEATGGAWTRLSSADDLLDLVVLTAADDMGGGACVERYLQSYSGRLSDGGRGYARLLLGPAARIR